MDSRRGQLERRGYTVTCSFRGLRLYPWIQEMYRERLLSVI